jgi:GntR family transcriptional regulator
LPGDQLPSEFELAQRFEVGRSTVREALKLLEQDGLVEARRGQGRFISPLTALRVERPITDFVSTTEMVAALGYRLENRVVSVELVSASAEEAEALGLDAGASVVRLERLRMHGGATVVYSYNTIDCRGLPDVATLDWSGSVNELLALHGRQLVSAAAEVRAAMLPRSAARRVAEGRQDPWLLIVETCLTNAGNACLYSRDYHRQNFFSFRFLRR